MANKILKSTKKSKVANSVDHINDQMDSSPYYPFNLQSEWLPNPGSSSMKSFLKKVLEAPPEEYAPSIKKLDELITNDEILTHLMDTACKENGSILASNWEKKGRRG